MILISPARAREMDARAAQLWGVAGSQLMENAGAAVARAVRLMGASRVCIVAGSGNNGGDGAVAARHLQSSGVEVRVHYVGDPGRTSGDALAAYRSLKSASPEVLAGVLTDADGGAGGLRADLEWADVVVDAVLGTGFAGVPQGPAGAAITLMNEHAAKVVSVDVPSGLDAATGRAPAQCVRACLTVSFGHAKQGLVLDGGMAAGRVIVDPIGFPRAELEYGYSAELLDPDSVRARLPARPDELHKGDAGRVLVVAGSPPMPGAAALASMACLRSGAGLSYLAAAPSVAATVVARHPEVVTMAQAEAAQMAASVDAVVVGPGLGNTPATAEVVGSVVERAAGVPVVLDADALNCLNGDVGMLKEWSRRGMRAALTPHPGELARIMGCSAPDIGRDRAAWARRAAEATGAVVVLKGARTLVAAPDGRLAVNPTGNSGMATAGSGDVLSGVLGAMCAGGAGGLGSVFDAACAAVFCHGVAGDLAAEAKGKRGMTAGDVLHCLPASFAAVERDPSVLWRQMPCVPMSLFERW